MRTPPPLSLRVASAIRVVGAAHVLGVALASSLAIGGCRRPAQAPATPVGCRPRETKLLVISHEGRAHRVFVEVARNGEPGLFLFDTGAARSHFRHDLSLDRVLPARSIQIGCEERWLESRASRALPPQDGLSITGTLGADALALPRGVAEIDLARGTLRTLPAVPREARKWPSAPLVMKDGVPLTDATIDGRPVRLLLDTGTEQTTVMVPASDDLGNGKIVRTSDAFGNPLALTEAVASLAWGDDLPARAPVYRTASFPAFEQHAAHLGGVDGVLGVASFGLRRIVLDGAGGRVWLEPVAR